jgi:hypothetical protein
MRKKSVLATIVAILLGFGVVENVFAQYHHHHRPHLAFSFSFGVPAHHHGFGYAPTPYYPRVVQVVQVPPRVVYVETVVSHTQYVPINTRNRAERNCFNYSEPNGTQRRSCDTW